MEGDKAPAARVSPSAEVAADTPSPPLPLPSNPSKEALPPLPPAVAVPPPPAPRQRYAVELRPNETTIVSWKKLVRSERDGEAKVRPAGADPPLASVAGPSSSAQPVEGDPKDEVPPPNRFSAVIEKIERLYKGKESSDEEGLGDNPDDDQYDTEDSFIDDAELDEYFQVEKLATKHNGYFVNRGKLEQIEASSSPIQAPKKRRRKDPTKVYNEKDQELIPSEPVNMGNMRIKAAARSAPLTGKKLSGPKILTPHDKHYQDEKQLKGKLDGPTGTYKKSTSELPTNSENPSSVKMPNKDAVSVSLESKELTKHKTGVISSRDFSHKSRGTSESLDGIYKASRDKGVISQVGSQPKPKKLPNGENNMEMPTKKRHRERDGVGELPSLNSSGKAYPLPTGQPSPMRAKEGSIVRPKGSTLERAIRDLQKIVGESRPPNLNVQEVDPSSPAIKRRLPQDIKQKLAKVARLAASQSKISENELLDRLMAILGHLVQRKTVKRHVREMVELGLSAKQQKDDKLQQISKELHEMIGTHVALARSKVSEQQDGSDDFQDVGNDEKRAIKGKFTMDKALEDKICDLYDLYVEGMDEDKGPQSRKLYVQLAELWPNGYMDNVGIKDAIFRSKERKRAKFRRPKVAEEERLKRKRLASSTSLTGHVRAGAATDPASQASVSQHMLISGDEVSKPYDKVRGSENVAIDLNRKLKKRKNEPALDEVYGQVKEKPNPHEAPYPPQNQQVAVTGSNLSSLT